MRAALYCSCQLAWLICKLAGSLCLSAKLAGSHADSDDVLLAEAPRPNKLRRDTPPPWGTRWVQDMPALPPLHAPDSPTWKDTVAVCAIMRDENITDVREWLQYYRCAAAASSAFAMLIYRCLQYFRSLLLVHRPQLVDLTTYVATMTCT